MPDEVITEIHDAVAWISLNRPDRLNAMNEALMDGLVQHLEDAGRNPDVRCVVVRGTGGNFSAGGDVAMMTDRHRGVPGQADFGPQVDVQVKDLDRRFASIELLVGMPKPTVAMMRGWALGGGLCLALACDLRIAAEDAKLSVGFLQRAISGNFGISFLLAQLVGHARARELAFLRDSLTAAEALAMGLVTVVSRSEKSKTNSSDVRTAGIWANLCVWKVQGQPQLHDRGRPREGDALRSCQLADDVAVA